MHFDTTARNAARNTLEKCGQCKNTSILKTNEI